MTMKKTTGYFFLWVYLLGMMPCVSAQSPQPKKTFAEMFIFGMVRLESGSCSLIREPSPAKIPVTPGTLLPTESIIETGPKDVAQLRLECGSKIQMAPETRIKILPFALDVKTGAIRVRHSGSLYPCKIQGASTLVISRDSLVEIERRGDAFLSTVQVGKMRTPWMKGYVEAGSSLETRGKTAKLIELPMPLRSWYPTSPAVELGDEVADIPDEIWEGVQALESVVQPVAAAESAPPDGIDLPPPVDPDAAPLPQGPSTKPVVQKTHGLPFGGEE